MDAHPRVGNLHLYRSGIEAERREVDFVGFALVMLVLRAFSRGCTALTGLADCEAHHAAHRRRPAGRHRVGWGGQSRICYLQAATALILVAVVTG
ncbi:hypothetical protein AB0C96_41180 [Streptomyces sp. NPDC048506]|uniref:hypothetical protein n=1 Tax=Streptomyces sp. NPDC048506 TaxID=3155028 RepID=UPI003432C626